MENSDDLQIIEDDSNSVPSVPKEFISKKLSFVPSPSYPAMNEAITKKIAKMIYIDMHLISIVEDARFRELIHFFAQSIETILNRVTLQYMEKLRTSSANS